MKIIYQFYCLFLFGNLLPILLIKFYFQEYFAVGIIAIIAIVVLTLCYTSEYFRIIIKTRQELMTQSDDIYNKIDYLDWLQKKEKKREIFYFFRKKHS